MASIRLLIVEDDQDIADLLQSALDPSIEFMRASNGLEGLQMALAGQPDLILSDIMMPVMDGYEFIKRLRREPGFEQVPVVFLSALGSKEQIREGYDLGAALYLTKPIDPGRFKRNLELFIDDHQIRPKPKEKAAGEVVEDYGPLPTPPHPGRMEPAAGHGSGQDRIGGMREEMPKASRESAAAGGAEVISGGAGQEAGGGGQKKGGEAKEKGEPGGNARPRILVVTDTVEHSDELKSALSGDYDVVTAGDGMEAIERAVKYLPDIFIVDGSLPKMTGFQLVTMLKKNKVFGDHPVVMISDKTSSRDRQYVRRLGVQHFLSKPISKDVLRETVGEIVNSEGFKIESDRVSARQMHLESLRDYEKRR